ncbi:MAG: type II secretion system protein [Pseudomonadota bacterium]
MNAKNGFTLIELAMVILVLGILAAVVIPKFVDMTSDARQAETNSVANALGAASHKNYALSRTGSLTAVSVSNCTNVANALPASYPLQSGYTITSASIATHASVVCTLTNPDGITTATFTGMGT